MSLCLSSGANLMCSFGTVPTSLNVLPKNGVNINGKAAACTEDNVPNVNIMPFGMCTSLSNPAVASATAAALGVLTPQPCMPNIIGTWMPMVPQVLIGGKPAVTIEGKLQCAYAGTISVIAPGQSNVMVG